MRIAIAGAGIAGAYLFRLLAGSGYSIDLFDIKNGTKCGMSPCAWGTSMDFLELSSAAGLDPRPYILGRFDHVIIDDLKIPAELMTIDKPRFLKDLIGDAPIRYEPLDMRGYDRVIDATGISRAFLPAIKEDVILPCTQCCVCSDLPLENRIRLGKIGYAWCFPLSQKIYHIGCGSLVADPREIIESLGWIERASSQDKGSVRCRCNGAVRLTSPYYSLPFHYRDTSCEIWGVGEAIGCVAPLAGDGIVPGMKSAQILAEYWDEPDAYQVAILEEFQWMKSERKVIEKLRNSRHLNVFDAMILKQNSKRMGMQVTFNRAVRLIRHLR